MSTGSSTVWYIPKLAWFSFADSFLRKTLDIDNKSDTNLVLNDKSVVVSTSMDNNDDSQIQRRSIEEVQIDKDGLKANEDQASFKASTCIAEKSKIDDMLDNAVETIKCVCKKQPIENEFTVFAKHIATQLEQLPLKEAVVVQSEIQNILTRARINSMNEPTNQTVMPATNTTEFSQQVPPLPSDNSNVSYSSNEFSMSGRKVFNIKEKVFAKVRGYSPWPAMITGIENKNSSRIIYHVRFYGTYDNGNCTANDLFPYKEYKLKLGTPKKVKYFNQALSEIENDNGDFFFPNDDDVHINLTCKTTNIVSENVIKVENIQESNSANEGKSNLPIKEKVFVMKKSAGIPIIKGPKLIALNTKPEASVSMLGKTQSSENVKSEYQPIVLLNALNDSDVDQLTKKKQNPENTDKDALETLIHPEIIDTPASVPEEKKLFNNTNRVIEDGEVPGPSNDNLFWVRVPSSVTEKSTKNHPSISVPYLINNRANKLLYFPQKNKGDEATASLKNISKCLKRGKMPSS